MTDHLVRGHFSPAAFVGNPHERQACRNLFSVFAAAQRFHFAAFGTIVVLNSHFL
jgi:hypothetical protein